MLCPQCKKEMQEVKTSCHYGIPIVIDQCAECGGLWFDEDELYRTKHGAAFEIEKEADWNKLAELVLFKPADLFCPKDKAKLKLFKDDNFPASLQILICPSCRGFWFNRGKFAVFQQERIKKQGINKDEKRIINEDLDKKLASVVKMYSDLEKNQTKKKLKDQALFSVMEYSFIIYLLIKFLFRR